MNKKTIIALGLTASTLFTGLVARQVVGAQAADRCQIAVDSYTELAEAQMKDMRAAQGMVEMIAENPFSALMVGGELVKIGTEAKERWNDLEVAEVGYLDSCVDDSLMGKITDSYTIGARQDKWATEAKLEETRENLMEAGQDLGW